MADVVPPDKRSQMMAGIRGKDTKPEMLVRRGLHHLGFRFRLHDRKLPGTPDLVLPKYRAAIFVNGCFWHRHECHLFKWPGTRTDFWRAKLSANRELDERNIVRLRTSGWNVVVLWECALKGAGREGIEAVLDELACWLTVEGRVRREGVLLEIASRSAPRGVVPSRREVR